MIGKILDPHCDNCYYAHIYRKAFCLEKTLTCTLNRQEDCNVSQMNAPTACESFKLISKLD